MLKVLRGVKPLAHIKSFSYIVVVNLKAKDYACSRRKNGKKMYSNGGWYSVTTKSRLNALGANVRQKNWEWYNGDGTPWVNGKLSDIR